MRRQRSMSGAYFAICTAVTIALLAAPVAAQPQPDLVAVKTNSVDGAGTVGETFDWSIALRNDGDSTATPGDDLPFFADAGPNTNMTLGTPTVTPQGGATGTLSCSYSSPGSLLCFTAGGFSMPAGASFTVTIPATPTAPGTFDNPRSGGACTVDLIGVVAESNEGNNACSDSVLVSTGATGPDLTVEKNNDVSGSTETGAGAFTWSLAVTNGGDSAASFTTGQTILRDNLPSSDMSYGTPTITGQSGISGTITCSVASSNLTCAASGSVTINAGGGFTANVDATPLGLGTFTNPRSAGVCAVDPDAGVTEGDENNNSCSDSVTVTNSPDLTVIKTNDTNGAGTVDEAFVWTLRVDNVGLADFVLTSSFPLLVDTLPNANMSYGTPAISSSGLTGTVACAITGSFDLQCIASTAVSLAASGSFTVTVSATPTTSGTFDNPRAAGVCAADPAGNDLETDESNNNCSNSVTVAVATAPDLTATKSNDVSGLTEMAAGTFTWSVQVANGGDDEASFASGQVLLVDNLPTTGVSYQSPTVTDLVGISGTGAPSCAVQGSNLSCTAQDGTVVLAPGTGTFTAQVVASPTEPGTLDNPRAAGVCSADPNGLLAESNESNNDCSNSVGVNASPDVIAVKSNDTNSLTTIGVPFTWSIKVENMGDAEWIIPVSEVVLLDNLPDADMTYGTPSISDSANLAGSVSCTIINSDLTCLADSAVGMAAGGHMTVSFSATPASAGPFENPRSGGICRADPSDVDLETDETNNDCADSVGSLLFADGFDFGNTDAWSHAVPE